MIALELYKIQHELNYVETKTEKIKVDLRL